MLTLTPDFIRHSNAAVVDLLESHQTQLTAKGVHTKNHLLSIIKQDLDKIVHGLLAVKNKQADGVLQTFFQGSAEIIDQVSPHVANNAIFHLGFEVYEPLDLILKGIDRWSLQASQSLGTTMQIHDYLRFPASQAFQNRVGAYTEIMRIWMEVDGRELMLELFDMYRPVDATPQGKRLYRNFDSVITVDQQLSEHDQQLSKLFEQDEIWHYALFVDSAERVETVHNLLTTLAAQNPHYYMPYQSVVINPHDKSIHTKIINQSQALEIELVSEI